MFKLNYKDRYNIVHVNNELGEYVVGGAGTYMNEIYKNRRNDMGFIHMNMQKMDEDFDIRKYPGDSDILIMHQSESQKIEELDFDILVIQFYEFAYLLTDKILNSKRIVYVVHSVPTPEPPPKQDPFGGNEDIRNKFERICNLAELIICVSYAEKNKLSHIYPQYRDKIKVVYNGITINKETNINYNYKNSRKTFGYIGRMDYRKGILECVKAIKDTDTYLKIAAPNNDVFYLNRVLEYCEAADLEDKVTFLGWCTGDRKETFFQSIDALIIPSLYEPFGYVALEAMQRGVLVISSNRGGLDEILSGYKYKYNPYKRGALEETIHSFMEDDIKILCEQQQILLQNLKSYTVEKMINNYNEIWEQLIKKGEK